MSHARSAIPLLLVTLAAGCVPQTIRMPESAAPSATNSAPDYGGYSLVLTRAVQPDGVDYSAILSDPSPLQRFLARIANVGPTSTPGLFLRPADRIAFDINAYNACILYAVIGQVRNGKLPEIPPRDPATGFRFQIDGRLQSSADLAHAAMKESGGDWRVAMALCGGRRSDPPLAARPFIGDVLDYQLTKNVVDGLSNPAVLRVDAGMQYLYLNKIMYDAQPRLIAAYQQRTGARNATILSVLLDMATRDQYPLLNSAIGYPVRPIPFDPALNASTRVPVAPRGFFSRMFGGP